MIPIRDVNHHDTFPILNYGIIAVNVAVFLYEVSLGPALESFVYTWGVVPARITGTPDPQAYLTPVSSMFMHGGWMHLIGNMWFLHVFGDNLEHVLGRVRYFVFYIVCGLGAVAAQVMVGPNSTIPMVGASGAVAGVLGGYMILFPRARVVTLLPVFVLYFIQLPAWVFLFLWFGYQLLMGVSSIGQTTGGGVAFFAHIGGFIVGVVLVTMLVPRRRASSRVWRGG